MDVKLIHFYFDFHTQIMNSLPMDVVKHILTYDRRFVLRYGKIAVIRKLDLNKYKIAILNLLLLKKPKIKQSRSCSAGTRGWDVYYVIFSNKHGIRYNIGYMGNKNFMRYTYGYNTEYTYVPFHTIDSLLIG